MGQPLGQRRGIAALIRANAGDAEDMKFANDVQKGREDVVIISIGNSQFRASNLGDFPAPALSMDTISAAAERAIQWGYQAPLKMLCRDSMYESGRDAVFKPQSLTLPYGEGHEPPPVRKHKLTKQGVRDLGGNYSKPRRDAELPVCHHIHCRPVYLKRFRGEMGITFDLYRCIYCHKKMTEMAGI